VGSVIAFPALDAQASFVRIVPADETYARGEQGRQRIRLSPVFQGKTGKIATEPTRALQTLLLPSTYGLRRTAPGTP
jgi:hypothetical protein